MAGTSLTDAIRIANKGATRSSTSRNSIKVCEHQCGILIAAFGHVEDFLVRIKDLESSLSNGRSASVWDETVSVLQRGVHLLKSCQESDWIVRSLLFEESCQDFQTIYTEIYSCVELVSVYLFQLASSTSERCKISEAYSTCLMRKNSDSMLEEAGMTDRRDLMSLALNSESGVSKKGSEGKDILCSMLLGKKPAINHHELKLRTHLGQGAFGTVYEARWLGQSFAVKVFAQGDISFDKELKVLSAHKHPNVLHIAGHTYDEVKRQYSLVMEKMDMDLANYLNKKKHPLPLLSMVELILQVATGMAWLHSRNIIHRDLKPQNVLISEESNVLVSVRIADFGVSRPDFISSMISDPTAKQGTRNFMAPEVWNGDRYSKKADVYSYAMLCYQVCLGIIPFKDGMVMEHVLNGARPTIPPDCPEFLAKFMKECWNQEVKARPAFSDICQRLKEFKAKTITGVESVEDVRVKLVQASQSSSSSSSSTSGSDEIRKTLVDLDSLIYATQKKLSTQNPYRVEHSRPRTVTAPLPDGRTELFEMVKKGLIKNAFEKALSLNDATTVWWLCTKVEHTVLPVFPEVMLMALAEQINALGYAEDTALKLVWMDEIGGLILKDYAGWASPRKLRILEQASQNLHGVIAVTPPNSELGMKVTNLMEATNMWLQRVRTAVNNKVSMMGIMGGYFPAEHK